MKPREKLISGRQVALGFVIELIPISECKGCMFDDFERCYEHVHCSGGQYRPVPTEEQTNSEKVLAVTQRLSGETL